MHATLTINHSRVAGDIFQTEIPETEREALISRSRAQLQFKTGTLRIDGATVLENIQLSVGAGGLAGALKAAADAHHEFEQTNGPDPDWPRWYADYIEKHYSAAS
jgi:hypothetical protein